MSKSCNLLIKSKLLLICDFGDGMAFLISLYNMVDKN